ncbi:hypothetical protein D4R78_05120 [bacterium]|nr:MAG: hypothetical protein D4R78_05120 [bacterium]
MEKKKNFRQLVEEIYLKDDRYKPDVYEFTLQALHFTQQRLKKEGHISGQELSQGLRDFSIEQYGPMARTVLNHWGIFKTQDFGNIVFNMIDARLLSKSESDSLEDFKDVYDFKTAFSNIVVNQLISGME